MKTSLGLLTLLFLAACNKPNKDCLVKSIVHGPTFGSDTLFYFYNDDQTIHHIKSGTSIVEYRYSNGRIAGRNTLYNGQLIRTDTISYNNSGNINTVVSRVTDNMYTSITRTDLNYQNNRLSSATSVRNIPGGSETYSASFTWTGENISKTSIQNSVGGTNSYTFAYSQNQNPFQKNFPSSLLTDPALDFDLWNLDRLVLFYSRNALSAINPGSPPSYGGKEVRMKVDAKGNIGELEIQPGDDYIAYSYSCR